jgi:hypothetical protein
MKNRGHNVNSGWIRKQSEYLNDIWEFLKCEKNVDDSSETSIVRVAHEISTNTTIVSSEGHGDEGKMDEEEDLAPPPPPSAMVSMTRAMKNMWHHGDHIPLVLPSKETISSFDRNDLYGTNENDLKHLLQYGSKSRANRSFDHMLMFVRLTSIGIRPKKEYITWCERQHFNTFASRVNHGEIVCNEYVTRALNDGIKFKCTSVCDEVGFIRFKDLDDHLYTLETYVTGFGTRHPRGYNTPDVPHMGSRSLHAMGGNMAALHLYTTWKDAIKLTKEHVHSVKVSINDVEKTEKTLRDWEAEGNDIDLIQSFRVNLEARVEETVKKLAEAEKAYTLVCTTRHKLKEKVVQALADVYIKYTYVTPGHLLSLRKTLAKPEPDHVAFVRTRVAEIQRRMQDNTMSVRRALIELDMWDGCGNIPSFTRASVNVSFACIARRIHPDKNDGRVEMDEHLDQFQRARNCLHQYLETT